jgi:hypothetical protein
MRIASSPRAWFAIFLLGSLASAYPQQSQPTPPGPITWDFLISKNFLPYHQLKTDDIPIDDQNHPKYGLFVKSFIQPSYHYIASQSPGGYFYVHIIDWRIYSGLNKNETSRKSTERDTKAVLMKAQMVLDLYEIYARQLAAMQPGELPSGEGPTFQQALAQLVGRVTTLVQTTLARAEKEGEQISDATNGGRDQKKVREYAAMIKKRLASIPVPTPTPTNLLPSPTASPVSVTSPTATRSPK